MADGKPDLEIVEARAIDNPPPEGHDVHVAQLSSKDGELVPRVEGILPEQQNRVGKEPPAGTAPNAARQRRRAIVTAAVMVILVAAAVAGAGVGVWALQKEKRAHQAELAAIEKEKEAENAAADLKNRLDQSEADQAVSRRERDQELAVEMEARHAAEDNKAVLEFLQNHLLTAGRPGGGSLEAAFWAEGQGKDVTLRSALDSAAARVAASFADRPLAEATVRELLGSAYLQLSQAVLAVKQYELAFALREGVEGIDHPDTAVCRNQLSVAYRLAGRTEEAAQLFDESPSAVTLAVRGALLLLQHKPAEAELKLRECLAIRQRTMPDDWTTALTKSLLGQALLDQKKFADAEPLLLAAYDGLKKRKEAIPPQERSRISESASAWSSFTKPGAKTI